MKQVLTSEEFLDAPVDLRRLVDGLAFDVDQLEEAARMQPRLNLEAGRFRVQKIRAHAVAKLEYDQTAAQEKTKIRKFINDKGKPKYSTEGAVAERSLANPALIRLRQKVDAAQEAEELAKMLTESYKQRSMMILVVGRIQSAEVNSEVQDVRSRVAQEEVNKIRTKARIRIGELEEEDDN